MKTLLLDTAHAGRRRLRTFGLVLIGALALLLYGDTLPLPFVFDDHVYLVDNPLMKNIRSFVWMGDFTRFANLSKNLGLDPDLSTNLILRPVTYFTFYLNYLADGMNPRCFRAVNIAIHGANAIVLLLLVSRLLRTSKKRGALPDFSTELIALFAALLFLVHPLQIESVTYVVQRFTSLGTLFYLLTILTYLRANTTEDWQAARRWRVLSIACLIVGLFTKEFLFTAPCLLFLLDWLVMGASPATAGRRTLPYFICLPLLPVLIFFTATAQHAGDASLTATLNIANSGTHSSYAYALTQLSVVLTYLRLIFVPVGLNLDWDYPLTTSLLDGAALRSLLLLAGLIGGAIYWLRHHGREVRHALLGFGVLWFFLTLAIDSSIVPLPDLLCEHRSYLPSIGVLCALAAGASLLQDRLDRWPRLRHLVPVLMVGWLLALAIATNLRHHVWQSRVGLWQDTTAKSPQKFRAWVNLGEAYYESKQPAEAVACFQHAIDLETKCYLAYRNLGIVENVRGNYKAALAALALGIQVAPFDPQMHLELGRTYAHLGDMQRGEQALRRAIEIQPSNRPAHLALGALYTMTKHYPQALEQMRIAHALEPLDTVLQHLADQLAPLVAEAQNSPPR